MSIAFPRISIAFLWIVWIVGWRAVGWSNRKGVIVQPIADRLAYGVPTVAGAMLLVANPRGAGLLQPWRALSPTPLAWFGLACVLAGLLFTVWARRVLGQYWSVMPTLKASHAIIRTGPYALVRHPIYTGLLLALFGTAVMETTVAAATGFLLVLIGFVIKAGQEERLLTGHFGAPYAEYQAQVPALVPRPWRRRS